MSCQPYTKNIVFLCSCTLNTVSPFSGLYELAFKGEIKMKNTFNTAEIVVTVSALALVTFLMWVMTNMSIVVA